MDKGLRSDVLLYVAGVVIMAILQAPPVVMMPYVTGIVLVINLQLMFEEFMRGELSYSRILNTADDWLDISTNKIFYGAVALSLLHAVLAGLAANPTTPPALESVCKFILGVLVVCEVSLIVLLTFGHVALRLGMMHKRVKILGIGIIHALLFFIGILVGWPYLWLTGFVSMIGVCGGFYSLTYGVWDENADHVLLGDMSLIFFSWIVIAALAVVLGSPEVGDNINFVIAAFVAIAEIILGIVIGGLGLLMLSQGGEQKLQ